MKGIVQLYHYGKMCTHVHSLQSCLTLGDPVDCSPPSSSVLGILQARILEWAAMPSSKGSSGSRDQTCISCIAGRVLTTESPGKPLCKDQFSSVRLLSCVRLFATPWTAACQASRFITNSQSSLRLMSIQSVMPSNHLILCRPLLLLPSIFPSIRVFSSELALHIRWPKCWSFSFSISPSSEYSGLISFRMDWLEILNTIL